MRIARQPSALAPGEAEGWASPQLWMGHAAVTTPEPALIESAAFAAVSAKLGHLPAWWSDLKRKAWAHKHFADILMEF